ncbi:MAG: GntG family PLP-dependent aldolase [Candidatus Fermentibacteraceae bacterium]
MSAYRVELRSDTFSLPEPAMRQAMAAAELGDDVFGEDPTVNALQDRVASLLGMEDAIFMPSGTMSNGVALRCLASPGETVVCGSASHVYRYEGGAAAMHGGLRLHRLVERAWGAPSLDSVREAFSLARDVHHSHRSVLALENTHNVLGGRVLPPEREDALLRAARSAGGSAFLDGARLWHAHVAGKRPLEDLASGYDLVTVCFSKAMGCPVGSVLAGPEDLIEKARWVRKMQGGGMRQAGVLAAACMYSLDHCLPELGRTHDYAARLGRAAADSPLLSVDRDSVETNIVMVDTPGRTAHSVADALGETGIGCLPVGPERIRLVTHLSLSEKDVAYAADTLSVFGG